MYLKLLLPLLFISLASPKAFSEEAVTAPEVAPAPTPAPTTTGLSDSGKPKMSQAAYAIGGILGTYPIGFGVGHAIQGRWTEKGWIFTTGEIVSLGLIIAGAVDCVNDDFNNSINGSNGSCNSGLLTAGVIGFVGFRLWEIIDVWLAPVLDNRIAFTVTPATHQRPGMLIGQLTF